MKIINRRYSQKIHIWWVSLTGGRDQCICRILINVFNIYDPLHSDKLDAFFFLEQTSLARLRSVAFVTKEMKSTAN